jgi:nitrogen regulatory protein P-II 1
MKCVVAVVRPFLLDQILDSLRLAPLEALQVVEVKGFGRQKDYIDQYDNNEYANAFLPKVEITMWVDDFRVQEVVDSVTQAARSGRMGDGKIFVMDVGHAVDIR